MTTIREAAIRQSIDKMKQNQSFWDESTEFVQEVIEKKFGLHCTLVDFLDDSESNYYLVEIDDKEFGKIYLKMSEFETCAHVFDKYRWIEAKSVVTNSIDLLRLLDYA